MKALPAYDAFIPEQVLSAKEGDGGSAYSDFCYTGRLQAFITLDCRSKGY